jgi:DNA polymerase-4
VKVRFGDFTTVTRSATFEEAEDAAAALAATGDRLLGRLDVSPGVRLLGLAVSSLTASAHDADRSEQLSLDLAAPTSGSRDSGPAGGPGPRPGAARARRVGVEAASKAATAAVDAVRRRFGDAAVGPAALLGERGLRLLRQGDAQWGPGSVAGDGSGSVPPRERDEQRAGTPNHPG